MLFVPDVESAIQAYYQAIPDDTRTLLDLGLERMIQSKQRGGKIVVITGSGPNLHEGVTTLIAELIDKGIVDGVSTSSAVIAHELAGTLDRVHRVNGIKLGIDPGLLPMGDLFEITEMTDELTAVISQEMDLDGDLIHRGLQAEGSTIIKAAGNMAYPMGLRTERLSREILGIAKSAGLPFETVAGWGADPKTMIGAACRRGIPVLVSVPQLIGGGGVGLAVGDSISITERCMRMGNMLDSAEIIIESAIALTQEIHDGPFETFTGHGIWAGWDGYPTTRLQDKTLIRIDLDPNLKRAWDMQRESSAVQSAIDKGLPKTKLTGIPFRMEMSGFARLENSLPLVGDIGMIWPIIAWKTASALGIKLDVLSHPQQTQAGQEMRDWIVKNIHPFDRQAMMQKSRAFRRFL
jgi:hypothetical protein